MNEVIYSLPETDDIRNFALNQLENVKNSYLKDPSLLLEQFELESSTTGEYNGRQLLEMIQNADDAAHTSSKPQAMISLKNDTLIIANNGEPFSIAGLDSILHSNLSPKFMEQNQIGNKGLGFRAILNWAKKIFIKSGNLQIAFSREYSNEVLEELIQINPTIREKIVERYSKTKSAIAILRCPEIIEDYQLPSEYQHFDTVIEVKIYPEFTEEIKRQIKNTIDAEMLLFLNHLTKVEVFTDNGQYCLEKEEINSHRIKTTSKIGENTESHEWNILKTKGTRPEDKDTKREAKNYELGVAWQNELTHSKNVLHSYFKTNVQFVFPGILHGTFELSGNRNELIKGTHDHNSFLFKEAAKLLANAAEMIADSNTANPNYKALQLVMVDGKSLNSIIKESDFEIELVNEVKKKNIFPTISGHYLNWNQSPVYYTDSEFARLLNPKIFTKLLLYCEIKEIEQFILSLNPYSYDIKDIIKSISHHRKEITFIDYAKLIKAIHYKIPIEYKISELPALFYDVDYNLLEFNKPIFLSNNEAAFEIPIEIGIQILHPALFKELNIICENMGGANLQGKLNKFRLREYKFSEVIEMIVRYFYNPNSVKEDIILLNKIIFQLFRKETNVDALIGIHIPLINKKGEVVNASQLYMGEDYQQPLTEIIYSYNKSKILASPRVFTFIDNFTSEWIKYVTWTGVALVPRKHWDHVSDDFAIYCMKHYDYRNSIEDYKYNDYFQFQYNLAAYKDVCVETIDDLENILLNNKTETILSWLNNIYKTSLHDNEPIYSSITIKLSRPSRPRKISGNQMQNYILWKISCIPWLNTETGIKQAPSLCTTSNTINADFSPLIEKPKIDMNSILFERNRIRKDTIDYLLGLIGVHKTISSISTSTLFSILMKLSEIDPEGKKAKSIYREIATNYDEKNIDLKDENYLRFIRYGKVFSRKGNTFNYIPIKESLYLDNKRYGESISNQFNVIEIDRRKGKEKIKKIFGVNPLDEVKLKLNGEPNLHPLFSKFEQEIEQFKPYLYVFRLDLDTKGAEKNLIKDIKYKLVNEVKVTLEKDGQIIPLNLANYEFLYFKEKQTIFIKTPENLTDEEILKNDMNFCDSISESFSALLDVDAFRLTIREYFSKSPAQRDDLIRTDHNLDKLILARNLLGIVNNPKYSFWMAFIKCFADYPIPKTQILDDELLENMVSLFPDFNIDKIFNELNYENYNTEESSEKIVTLLKGAGKTIEEFNKYLYPPMDITELYEVEFKRYKDQIKSNFKNRLYKLCLGNKSLRINFMRTIDEYEDIKPTVINKIDFDVEQDLKSKIKAQFSIDMELETDIIEIDEIYLNNRNILVLKLSQNAIAPKLIDQFFSEERNYNGLVYFGDELDDLAAEINKWASTSVPPSGNPPKSKRMSFGKESIFYNDFKDLKQQIDTIIEPGGLKGITSQVIKVTKPEVQNSVENHPQGSKIKKHRKTKEDIGFVGEYLVYQYLLDSVDKKDSVRWVSENAQLSGVNIDGNDGQGYDLVYIPNGAKNPRYIEVKVVGHEDSFHISSNEIKSGEKWKSHYEIFLVRNIDNPLEIKIEKIQGLFDYKGKGSFNNNDYFTVINDSFIIKFNKKDELLSQ
jgi:hypothetical protein